MLVLLTKPRISRQVFRKMLAGVMLGFFPNVEMRNRSVVAHNTGPYFTASTSGLVGGGWFFHGF